MINSKYTSWLSSLTAVFTLAFASGVRAAVIPAPTPTATYQLTGGTQPQPPYVFDDLEEANTASFISQVYVNGVDPNPDLSTVYNVCFEYGTFNNIFNANRTEANGNLPCVDVASQTIPAFFGSSTLAALAAGGIDPSNANPPMVPIRSSGILTPLNASLTMMGGSQIRRVVGNGVYNFGLPEDPPIVDAVGTITGLAFLVPYGLNNGGNNVTGVLISYNDITDVWDIDPMNTSTSVNAEFIFARFGPTGDTVDVGTPTNTELPEPSAIGGLLLVGTALWLTKGRR